MRLETQVIALLTLGVITRQNEIHQIVRMGQSVLPPAVGRRDEGAHPRGMGRRIVRGGEQIQIIERDPVITRIDDIEGHTALMQIEGLVRGEGRHGVHLAAHEGLNREAVRNYLQIAFGQTAEFEHLPDVGAAELLRIGHDPQSLQVGR